MTVPDQPSSSEALFTVLSSRIQLLPLARKKLVYFVRRGSDVDGQAASEKLRVAFPCSKTGRSCIIPLTMKWSDHITVDPQIRYD